MTVDRRQSSSAIVDLFGGPGGLDLAAKGLGLDPLGIEWDDAACATRKAAGLRTLQADVAALNPSDWSDVEGVIASPPCPPFSMAGKGGGRRDQEHIVACAHEIAVGHDTRARHVEACEDKRSILVVEPLRWAVALRPQWIVLEQVPPVLALWTVFAELLGQMGYSTWAGILEAERYGVPQTRERAFLLARLDGPVAPPRATHQRYVPGEPARHDITLEGEVLPWISMAQALGLDELAAQRWHYRNGNQPNAVIRRADQPAPTLHFGHALNSGIEWTMRLDEPWRPVAYDSRQQRDMRSGIAKFARQRLIDEPAPTIAGQSRNDSWIYSRPATTVAGDSRIWPPGHKRNADDERAGRDGYGDRAGTEAIRVSIDEAAVLQTFPPDYPWQGTKTKQFEQCGNAVPPGLASRVLSAVAIPTELAVAA